MAANVDNVQLGVCKITVITAGVSRDIGHTIGGAEGVYGVEFHTVQVDKYTGMADQRLIKEKWGAKFNAAELTLDNLNLAMTHAVKSASKITVGSFAGKSSRSKAVTIVLHPIELADNDHSFDWVIFKAVSTAEMSLAFKNDGERVIPVTVDGLVDEGRADGTMLGLIGDSAS